MGALVRCFGVVIQGNPLKAPTLPSPGVPGEGTARISDYARKVI